MSDLVVVARFADDAAWGRPAGRSPGLSTPLSHPVCAGAASSSRDGATDAGPYSDAAHAGGQATAAGDARSWLAADDAAATGDNAFG